MKRESERNAKTKLAIDPWLIGYATVVFWVQFAAGSWFSGTAEADNVLLRDFAIWAAASQLALAVAYFASIRVFPSLKTWLSETPGTTAASIASTLASLGILILLANARWYILAGIVFGAGCIVSYALWGQLMSRRSFASILANTLIGQGVGAVLVYTASLLEWNRALWLIAVTLFASSLCLVACAIGTRRQRIDRPGFANLPSDDMANGSPESNPQAQSVEKHRLPSFSRKDVLPFLLVIASSVVAAMNSCGYDSSGAWARFGTNSIIVPLLMSLVAAAFLYLYLKRGVALYYCFVAFPLLAGIAVVLQLLPLPDNALSVKDISFALSYLSNLFGFAFLCMLARRSNDPSPTIFVGLRALMAGAMLISYLFVSCGLASFVTGFAQGILFVSLLFGAGVSYLGTREEDAISESQGTVPVATLARTWGLTKREIEIAQWLLKGYQAPYIAQQLFISENTVRTHIKSMYRKMGVANRNEFLAAFEEAGPGLQ